MRYSEFAPEQLDEALPDWARKTGLAIGGGAALATGAHMLNQPPEVGPQVRFELPQEKKFEQPKIKADPGVVKQMLAILKTPAAMALTSEARAAGMKGRELAQFLAQCAHETLNFASLKEIGNHQYFKRYDIQHNPDKAKILGNIKAGDGAKYIGRGFIQLTGRENYRKAGKALGLSLEEHPELVEKPDIAAKVAVWYWKHRVHPKIHDYTDTEAVTHPINNALRGLKDRDEKFKAVAQILGVLNWTNQKNT
jgi:predicted chitinase